MPTNTKSSAGARWWLLLAAGIYSISIAATEPPFRGDAWLYVSDALSVRAGTAHAGSLWEFGHLLWRPLIWALSPVLVKWVPAGAWSPNLKVLYGLVWIGRLSGLAAVLLMADLLRRIARRPAAIVVPLLTMVWGAAFLGYAQAGGPYIPALALSILALWWNVAGPGSRATRAVVAGLVLAGAVAIWFPFVLIIPASACACLFLEEENVDKRYRWALLTMVTSGAVLLATFAWGAALAGHGSLREFPIWMQSSSHGWQQNRTVLRAVSGCSRLFIELGSGGIALKRFLIKDPYNSVSAAALFFRVLWRIALFWIFIFAIAFGALRSAPGRRMMKLALIAVLPVLFFALALLEPSSPERFLPILPFPLLALAVVWDTDRKALAIRMAAIAFAALLPIMNGPTMVAGASAERIQSKTRLEEFRRCAGQSDLLMTPVLTDPLWVFSNVALFDPVNLPEPISMEPIITAAKANTGDWRRTFAEHVLETWRRGAEVWITKAALADRPPASTYWVEGDDPRVRWRDLPEFLRPLEYDKETPDSEGFRRIHHSLQNEAALRKLL